jgi:hypothetical protein
MPYTISHPRAQVWGKNLTCCNITLAAINVNLFIQVLKGKMGNLGEEYEILEEIGRGNYSICKRCIHRASKVNNVLR